MIFSRDKYKKDIDESVRRNLAVWLSSLEYEYKGVTKKSSKTISLIYSASFVNKKAQRSVELTYIPVGVGKREVLILSIKHTAPEVNEFDYTSTYCMTVPGPEIYEQEGELSQKLDSCLSYRAEIMKSDFLPILNGKVFETEHFDWQGLK